MTLTSAPMASRLSRRPSRRKQKKRSQNCGANTRALVSSTGKREGRKFGRHWPLSKRFLLELLVDVHDCFGGTERIAGEQSECSAAVRRRADAFAASQ